MAAKVKGTLEVKCCSGRELLVVQKIGKQDPFLQFEYNATTQRIRADNNGGQKPVWNEVVTFKIVEGREKLGIQCYDENLRSHAYIGEVVIELKKVLEQHTHDAWFPLTNSHKNIPAGEIYLEFTYYPADGSHKPFDPAKKPTFFAPVPVNLPAKTAVANPNAPTINTPPPGPNMTNGNVAKPKLNDIATSGSLPSTPSPTSTPTVPNELPLHSPLRISTQGPQINQGPTSATPPPMKPSIPQDSPISTPQTSYTQPGPIHNPPNVSPAGHMHGVSNVSPAGPVHGLSNVSPAGPMHGLPNVSPAGPMHNPSNVSPAGPIHNPSNISQTGPNQPTNGHYPFPPPGGSASVPNRVSTNYSPPVDLLNGPKAQYNPPPSAPPLHESPPFVNPPTQPFPSHNPTQQFSPTLVRPPMQQSPAQQSSPLSKPPAPSSSPFPQLPVQQPSPPFPRPPLQHYSPIAHPPVQQPSPPLPHPHAQQYSSPSAGIPLQQYSPPLKNNSQRHSPPLPNRPTQNTPPLPSRQNQKPTKNSYSPPLGSNLSRPGSFVEPNRNGYGSVNETQYFSPSMPDWNANRPTMPEAFPSTGRSDTFQGGYTGPSMPNAYMPYPTPFPEPANFAAGMREPSFPAMGMPMPDEFDHNHGHFPNYQAPYMQQNGYHSSPMFPTPDYDNSYDKR